MIPWLDYLPLMTLQRALHLLFPAQTANWSFLLIDNAENKERKVYQHFMWSYSGEEKPTVFTPLGNIPRYPLVVAFQPPWILSAQDMLEFSQCRVASNSLSFSVLQLTPSSVSGFLDRQRPLGCSRSQRTALGQGLSSPRTSPKPWFSLPFILALGHLRNEQDSLVCADVLRALGFRRFLRRLFVGL